MGCFGSRMDSRRKAMADDWTGAEYAFNVGSITTLDGCSPLDKIVIKFVGGEGKELSEKFSLEDTKLAEDKAKEYGEKIFTALKALHAKFKGDKDSDDKVQGKYTGKEAFAQIDAAVKLWCEKSGLEHKMEEEATAAAPEGMEGMMEMMEEMAEGGEVMEAAAEAPAAAKRETPEISAFGDFAGPGEIPKLLTAMMVAYPAFGDAVKVQVVGYELGGDGDDDFAEIAAITGAYVNAGERAEGDSYGAAWLGAEDLEELTEAAAAKETSCLIFPGVTTAWADKATAIGNAGEASGKTKVVFHFKGKVMKPCGDKALVFCRQFSKITDLKDEDGVKVCELEDFTDAAFATVKEYTDKVAELKAAAEAAAAAVGDAAADMMDKPMEEAMMMEEAPAE